MCLFLQGRQGEPGPSGGIGNPGPRVRTGFLCTLDIALCLIMIISLLQNQQKCDRDVPC